MKRSFAIFSLAILICFSMSMVSCQGQADMPGENTSAPAGTADTTDANKAPDFALKDMNGNIVTLSDFKGKVLIIDFWATWCPPCKAEIPHFQSLYEEYAAKGLVVLGISVDRNGPSVVKPFILAQGVTYPIVMGTQSVVNNYGGIRGIPTTFIVDRNGNIVDKVVGYRDKAFFEEAVKKLL